MQFAPTSHRYNHFSALIHTIKFGMLTLVWFSGKSCMCQPTPGHNCLDKRLLTFNRTIKFILNSRIKQAVKRMNAELLFTSKPLSHQTLASGISRNVKYNSRDSLHFWDLRVISRKRKLRVKQIVAYINKFPASSLTIDYRLHTSFLKDHSPVQLNLKLGMFISTARENVPSLVVKLRKVWNSRAKQAKFVVSIFLQ